MKKQFFVLGVVSLFTLSCSADLAKLEALVVDEVTDMPIQGVRVSGLFCNDNGWRAFMHPAEANVDVAVTDVNGRCRMRGRTNNGQVGCHITSGPSGYYWIRKGGGYDYKHKNLLGIWQPDNVVVTIRLQRVGHPIPLLKKRITRGLWDSRDLFELSGERLRFDFMKGDWLPPVGTGTVADVEFTRLPRIDLGEARNPVATERSYRDSMAVKFLGADNGLVEQRPLSKQGLKIRVAPEDGYKPDYLSWIELGKTLQEERSWDASRCFCFRIRARRDDKGRIVEAYYGKIYDDFAIEYKSNPFVPVASPKFDYYLNPTSLDRNLEWDRKTNLFSPRKRIWNPNGKEP